MTSTIMPDSRTARALLRDIGIIVGDAHIVPVPGGTINTTFRIEQGQEPPLYLRIAPSDAEVESGPGWMTSHGLRREVEAIGLLESLVSLLPKPIHTDWSRQLVDRDWVVQTQVPGRPWSEVRAGLTEEEDRDVWRQLGTITREIHSIPASEFGPPEEGFGHDAWSELVRWDVTGFLVDAQRFDIDVDPFQRLTTLVNQSVDVLDKIIEPRLIHSDLHDRHVFVRRTPEGAMEISGLIDFEFARFADPYAESVFVMSALHGEQNKGFPDFCDAYGCDLPSRDSRLRSMIYQLTALGWTVMDLHRRQLNDRISGIFGEMTQILDDAEGLL